jgi:predicted ArsR family transcriptional regulator
MYSKSEIKKVIEFRNDGKPMTWIATKLKRDAGGLRKALARLEAKGELPEEVKKAKRGRPRKNGQAQVGKVLTNGANGTNDYLVLFPDNAKKVFTSCDAALDTMTAAPGAQLYQRVPTRMKIEVAFVAPESK